MVDFTRHNTQDLIKSIQNMHGVYHLHFPMSDFIFSKFGKNLFANYKTNATNRINFQNLYVDICNLKTPTAKVLIQAIFAEYVIVNIVSEIQEFYTKTEEHDIFNKIDSYVILNMVRNALSHTFTWRFKQRTKNRLNMPIKFKNITYDISLDGEPLDLKYFSYKILSDLIDDLCKQLLNNYNKTK